MLKRLLLGLILTSALLVGCSSDGEGTDVDQPAGGNDAPAQETPAEDETQS